MNQHRVGHPWLYWHPSNWHNFSMPCVPIIRIGYWYTCIHIYVTHNTIIFSLRWWLNFMCCLQNLSTTCNSNWIFFNYFYFSYFYNVSCSKVELDVETLNKGLTWGFLTHKLQSSKIYVYLFKGLIHNDPPCPLFHLHTKMPFLFFKLFTI